MNKTLIVIALLMFLSGCREPKEYAIQNELKPVSARDLFEMPMENLDRVDIGRMNIICARNVIKSELIDTEKYVGKLDEWAAIAKRMEFGGDRPHQGVR